MPHCTFKAEHSWYSGLVCPECKQEASTAPTEATRRFSVSEPEDGLRQEMGEIKWRLNLLKLHDLRTAAIVKAARARLPLHMHVMVSIQPRITAIYRDGDYKKEPRFAVSIDAKEARGWDELNGLFEELDSLGYQMEVWQSEDHPNFGYRAYTWTTKDGGFQVEIKLYPKEEPVLDEKGQPVATCKKILIGKKFHRGYDHMEDVFAFDCGQGEDALRAEAQKSGRL